MLDEDAKETNRAILKVNKVCRFINVLMKIIFVIFCVFMTISLGSMVYAAALSGLSSQLVGNGIFSVVLYLFHGVAIAFMLGTLISIFEDVSSGESPFMMKQIRRLRFISGLLLVYAVLDICISQNNLISYAGAIDYGYISTSDTAVAPLNLAPFLAAGVVFAFSYVFKYGVLLQEFSDETL